MRIGKLGLRNFSLLRAINTFLKGRILDFHYKFNMIRFGDYWNPFRRSDQNLVIRTLILQRRKPHAYKTKGTKEHNIFFVGTYFDHESQGFLQGLRRMGQVHVYTNADGKYGFNPPSGMKFTSDAHKAWCQHLCNSVLRAHEVRPIDFVVGTFTGPSMLLEALLTIREIGIPIVNYAMDDMLPSHWKIKNGIRMGAFGLAPAVDISLHTTPSLIPRYLAAGFPAIYFPFASDPEIFSPSSKRDIDVLFIGNCYGKRERLVSKLMDAGIHIDAYGLDFPRGHVSGEQVPALFGRAKIILGSGLIGHSGKLTTLKLRDFDAPMSGALYLTSVNPDLEKHFDIGNEILIYNNIEDCIAKIKYYLDNEDERIRVANRGRARALREHTWDQRMKIITQVLLAS